jgi:antirestriction protein ArdC
MFNINNKRMKAYKKQSTVDIYEKVTAMIMEKLREGVVPWRKTWREAEFPANYLSKKPYKGINFWLLASFGFEQPYFLTFLQVKELGGTIKKGEKALPVVYWNYIYTNKEDGRKIEAEQVGNYPACQIRKKSYLKHYNVFNISSVEGVDFETATSIAAPPKNSSIQSCEQFIDNILSKPSIHYGGNQAYYHPIEDFIQMPKPKDFESPENYYAVLFHELIHATGHPDRLNREGVSGIHPFGTAEYSKEELIAEMGAGFLCAYNRIFDEQILDNSTAYINGWLKKLSEDKFLLIEAASKAQKAVEYLMNDVPF